MRSHALDSVRRHAGTIVLDTRRGVRARPWGTRPGLAHLVIADHTDAPPADRLAEWLDELRARGFDAVRTGAMSCEASQVFRELGFVVEQTLTLLRVDPCATPRSTRRHRAHDESAALRSLPIRDASSIDDAAEDLRRLATIDQQAFGTNWGIDPAGIVDACSATPAHRLRLAGEVAFAITGRAGSAGFLQRLAVRPDHQGRGIGRQLVLDSLQWLRRRRVHTAMVNTHDDNEPALALYRSVGFERVASDLFVLTLPLRKSVPAT